GTSPCSACTGTSMSRAARPGSAVPWHSTPAASTPRASCGGPSSPCPGRRACVATSSSPAEPAGTVAVIGSARLGPPDPPCVPAERIGALVGARGWTLVTGGYGGLMGVAAQAAAQAGGRVVGLPMRNWVNLTPSKWNHELRWSETYAERLGHLLAADA